MKTMILILCMVGGLMLSCNSTKATRADKPVFTENDTVRIANNEAEFEIIIFDPAFNSWFNAHARPRSYYTQQYLETRNRTWVSEWNNRAAFPQRHGNIYDSPINYNPTVDYGFEVNYMLFNYLTYFQIKFDQRLGGFVPRV